MTYTKLIERLKWENADGSLGEITEAEQLGAADAIEALQAQCASLNQIAELNAQIVIDLKAERDALQARLDAMGKGEPASGNVEILLEAAEVLGKVQSQCDDAWERFGLRDYLPDELHGTALIVRDSASQERWVASQPIRNPKALAPLTADQKNSAWDDHWSNPSIPSTACSAFYAGMRFAEKHHGIGGTP